MTIVVDDLGAWFQFGYVTPEFVNFSAFSVESNTSNNVYRFSVFSSDYSALKTVVYLRAVYQFLGKKVVDRRWFKFYPKPEPEIFSFNENESLIFENSFVGFEVIKKLKYRRVGFTVTEESYQVLLEEFLPLDNTLKEIEGTNNLSKIINLNLAESENKITNNLINRINEVVAYQVNISREATINSIIRFFTGGV